MPTIKVLPHAEYCPRARDRGARRIDLRGAARERLPIEHACEMSCACTTCHVIVREGYPSLGETDESEEDLLDRAWGLEPTSRLRARRSCAAGPDGRDPEVLDQPRQGKPLRGPPGAGGERSVCVARRSVHRPAKPAGGLIESKNESGTVVSRSAMTARPSSISTKARISDFFRPLPHQLGQAHEPLRHLAQRAAMGGAPIFGRKFGPGEETVLFHRGRRLGRSHQKNQCGRWSLTVLRRARKHSLQGLRDICNGPRGAAPGRSRPSKA